MANKLTYTAGDVAGGFAGAATFSPQAAAAVAEELNAAGDLGSMDPDDAARAVQAAVYKGTKGATVSIDLSLTALTAIHARKGAEGVVVGFQDQEGAARATSSKEAPATGRSAASPSSGSGTAAQAGPGSQGAGAGADATVDAKPSGSSGGRKLSGAAKAAADRKAARAAGTS